MISYKSGICCVCQCAVPLQPSPIPRQQELDRGLDDWDINREYGESINYVVIDHIFYGQKCDGSGQIPQALI